MDAVFSYGTSSVFSLTSVGSCYAPQIYWCHLRILCVFPRNTVFLLNGKRWKAREEILQVDACQLNSEQDVHCYIEKEIMAGPAMISFAM